MRSREQLSNLLQSSADAKSVAQLHSLLLRNGHLNAADCFFATRLTASYSKLPSVDLALKLFDEIPRPTTFLWNAALRAHSRTHQWLESLRLFRRMHNSHRRRPDAFSLPIALKACAALSTIGPCRTIHSLMIKTPHARSDMFVGAALIGAYAKCGEMGDARLALDEFPEPDVVLWTSVITGYQQNGFAGEAVSLFSRMVVDKCAIPDPVTLVSVVSALGQLGDLRAGRCCHGFLIRMGFDFDLSLVNSVLNMYAKLGAVGAARTLFEMMPERDVITWSCMIACHARNGNPDDALNAYKLMVDMGMEPNSVTVISVLQACTPVFDLQEGRKLHDFAIQKGFELDVAVSTALIDMYMKCSCCSEAMDIFHRMPRKDAVSYAAVIGGYAQNGFANESLKVFHNMLSDEVRPDAVTMVKVLGACSELGILRQALCFHGYLVSSGFNGKVFVGAALVDSYSKCGSLDSAVRVFKSTGEKDVVLWSSMIAGYGIHGFGSKAIATFEEMIESSIRPSNVTFMSVLSACSHAGLVEEGREIFDSMGRVYGIIPDSDHYGIMVDLLGRTGELREAMRLIEGMSTPVGPHVWCALLAGCRIHQNIKMGELVAGNLLKLEPGHSGYYKLLSNIYAFDGRWDSVAGVRGAMKERVFRKIPGYSSVEIGNEVHTFLAGERLHQEWERIRELLRKLEVSMREEGYVPDRSIGMPMGEEDLFRVWS